MLNNKTQEMLSVADIETILNATPAGVKLSDDEYFREANASLFEEFKKLGVLSPVEAIEEDEAEEAAAALQADKDKMTTYCDAPGCSEKFPTTAEYQRHFRAMHNFMCSQCKRSLPTDHLLSLHLAEKHDSFFAARLERGTEPMYVCYVLDCAEKLWTPDMRRKHCIEVHHFPANYRFELSTKQKGKQKKCIKVDNAMECDDVVVPIQQQNTSKSFGTFNFGRSKQRTFKATKQQKTAPLEDFTELKMSLDEA